MSAREVPKAGPGKAFDLHAALNTWPDAATRDDMLFLAAWEDGLVPLLSGFLRARQIYRGSPHLAAPARAGGAG